jgi:hypothetical protein
LPAQGTGRDSPVDHPVGTERLQQQAAPVGQVRPVRTQGRYPAASNVAWQRDRLGGAPGRVEWKCVSALGSLADAPHIGVSPFQPLPPGTLPRGQRLISYASTASEMSWSSFAPSDASGAPMGLAETGAGLRPYGKSWDQPPYPKVQARRISIPTASAPSRAQVPVRVQAKRR